MLKKEVFWEVLQAKADGLSYKQIAGKMDTTEQCVKNLVYQSMKPFKAENITHAVALAFRQGIVR